MKKSITNKQVCSILYCILNGYGVINLPKNAAESAGTGGWVAIFIVTILSSIIVYIITYIQYNYEEQTIYEYSEKLVGKFISNVIIIIIILYFFAWYTLIIRIYAEDISLTILLKTNFKYISIVFYMVLVYAIIKGLKVIVSVAEIYAIISIIFSIFLIVVLFVEGDKINLMPIFVKEEIPTYIKSIPNMITPFLGTEILFMFQISKSNNKNICKYVTVSMIAIGLIYILLVESAISVVGVESVVKVKVSMFNITKGIDVRYLEFLRRLDGLYIFSWTLNIVVGVSMWGYGTCKLISKMVKNINYNCIVIVVSLTSFITGMIPKSLETVKLLIKYLSYGGVLICFIMPIIFLIIMKWKLYVKKI